VWIEELGVHCVTPARCAPRRRAAAHARPALAAPGRAQARWLQTTRAPIRRITFQWRDRAPVAVHGSIDG